MYKLLKGEFLKLKYSRGFRILFVLSVIFGLASPLLSSSIEQEQSISGYEIFFSQFIDLRTLIFVFAGIFSGFFIGEDFSSRAIQSEITSGYSRFAILFSKTLVYMFGICVLIKTQVLIVTLITTLINGFGIAITVNVLVNMFRALFMFMFLICSSSMLYVLTSFWLKSVGSTLAVNMLLLVIIDGIFQIGAMLKDVGIKLYETTTLLQVILASAEQVPSGGLAKAVVIGIVTSLLLFILTYFNFKKAELK